MLPLIVSILIWTLWLGGQNTFLHKHNIRATHGPLLFALFMSIGIVFPFLILRNSFLVFLNQNPIELLISMLSMIGIIVFLSSIYQQGSSEL